jgi:SAM-dependent methyltransferase
MNTLENWFCSTRAWQHVTRRKLLPWLFADSELGKHVLEVGAGPGAATADLHRLAPRVTSLEYDHAFLVRLARQNGQANAAVVQGDAARLPFAGKSFSSAVAVLLFHHLRSSELQDRAFAEIHRVLHPGGQLFAFELMDGLLNRVIHTSSTFVPIGSQGINGRLTRAGFAQVSVTSGHGGFRFRASRQI